MNNTSSRLPCRLALQAERNRETAGPPGAISNIAASSDMAPRAGRRWRLFQGHPTVAQV